MSDVRTYRIRKLSQSGDGEVSTAVIGVSPAAVFRRASEQAGAVYDVNAKDLTMSEAQVVEALNKGWLQSSDLVSVDGQWCSLADSVPFGDVAEVHAKAEAGGRTFMYALIVGAIVLFAAVRVWLRPG